MMGMQLLIDVSDYVLRQSDNDGVFELARLKSGARALIADNYVQEAHLEHAIQVAEDWLMPYTALLQGQTLDVRDVTGRLEATLSMYAAQSASYLSLAEIEQVFLTMVDRVLRHAPADVATVADIILVRELAHHGQVTGVRIHR